MKILRRITLAAAVLLALQVPAQAQETFFGKVGTLIGKFTAPNKKLDSNYVYQRPAHWNVSIGSGFMQTGVDQTTTFTVAGGVPCSVRAGLQEGLYKNVGLKAGYGSLALGYNFEIGHKSALKRKSFSFDLLMAGGGVQFQYYDIQDKLSYSVESGQEGTAWYDSYSGVSDAPGRLRTLVVDGYYCFNRSTFVLSGAYRNTKLQARSAGSFLIGAKYRQGDFSLATDQAQASLGSPLLRSGSAQVSVGGGYSFNWVPLHRPACDEYGKGLRNLTFNITAMPLVTLYNKMDFFTGEASEPMIGQLGFSYTSRAGIAYSFSRFGLNLYGAYDIFSFVSSRPVGSGRVDVGPVSTSARFRNWQIRLDFTVQL